MNFEAAISEHYDLYLLAGTMNNIEAGEFPDDILGPKIKAFISSLDIDEYGALLELHVSETEGNASDWLESAKRFMDSLSDEQKKLYNRI